MRGVLPLILALASCASAANDAITIHIVNGKYNKPLANEHVLVFYGDSEADISAEKHHYETRTDTAGNARVIGATGLVQVWVDWHPLCEARVTSFSVESIRSSGIVAPNTCGSATHEATPGE